MTAAVDTSGFTPRQRDLFVAVMARTSAVNEALVLIHTLARTVGASGRDVETVKTAILAPHIRECHR